MRVTKDAHCTESLDQRPLMRAILRATCAGISRTCRALLSAPSMAALTTCLCLSLGLTSPALSQSEASSTADAATTEENSKASEQPAEPEPPEEPIYNSREERDMSLLAEGVDAETAVWLTALEQPFLALYEQELTGEAVGAVLIINAEGQHSSWPTTSERIRMSLPEFGWNTLSTELPLPESRPIPKRPMDSPPPASSNSEEAPAADDAQASADPAQESASEPTTPAPGEDKEIFDSTTGQLSDGSLPTEESAGEKPAGSAEPAMEMKIPAEDIAVARLHAAINYLHQQGQFNIVMMGSGVGALRSACFLKEIPEVNSTTQTRLVRAMVIINARNRLPNDDRQLHKCLDTPDMPVLDLYVGREQRDQVEARERRKYANKKNYQVFQQLRLPEMARNTMLGENRLSRRVRGFMEQHARGVKVDNAIIKNP